jgi:hypothetical protein
MLKRLVAAVIFGILIAGCTSASTTVNTTANTFVATTSSSAAATTTTTTKPVATIGSTLSLDDGEGNTFTVTLIKVVDPAKGATQFDTAPAGDVLAEVLIKITGTKGNYMDDADSTISVIGSDDQTYSPGFESIAGCTNFNSGDFTVTPGQSVTGCDAIEIKKGVKLATIEYTGGASNTVGEWKIPA